MSTYTSQEEKIILKNNNKITSINLNNPSLKVLIIDNLSNLEIISIFISDELYVSVSNCEKLKNIETGNRFLKDGQSGNYFCLGENLKSLDYVNIVNFKTVKIADDIFDKLESLFFNFVKNIICNFKNFPILNELVLVCVTTSYISINSEVIKDFIIEECDIENIEITKKGFINNFEFNNSTCKSLKVEHSIGVSSLTLYNYNDKNKVLPYIPISDDIDEDFNFYVNINNIYDYKYKFFIESNPSKVNIKDEDYEEVSLEDMKFNVPQKKRAR